MPARASILISVSKKKFKRAVNRNKIKRQVREAYRLLKPELITHLEGRNKNLLIAFLYIDKEIHPHTTIEKAMKKTVTLLTEKSE